MKVPLWKYYLSYLFELHIESAPSEINPHLYVSLLKGRYQLSTANAVYSYADLYDNFKMAFQKIFIEKRAVENVLLLGFGLGSIPYMLEKNFKRTYHYTGVEIDENVLYLANKYTLPDLTSSINMIPADAYSFIGYCQETFDLICMDVFLDDVIPAHFQTSDFLFQLQALLNPDGILLFNKLALTEEDKKACELFLPIFTKCFPAGAHIDVNGNWIFVNDKKLLLPVA